MKKNKILLHILFVVIAIQISAVFSFAKIGFDAKLYTPPLFISGYDNVQDQISVAIYPTSYPYLSSWLAYKPRAKTSFFDENSIRFETQYYGLGREKYYLIPVSVDAKNYSDYRLNKLMRNTLNENFKNSMDKDEEKRRSSGLGVQVALPKRFEKLFGEGSAGLKISGKRKISFAGRSNWTDQATTGTSQSKFPSLVMEQVSRFNITGNIGSKITVKVSQDSQTDIPLSNRIQIRYLGDEDDVLKTIEAGNTTLSLPRTDFVGYSSTVRGLFGVKSEAQIGNLHLTAIASQEKGSSETTSITAGGQESVEYVRDYEYVERRIFDLVLPFEKLKSTEKITKLLMYESVPSYGAEENQLFANFYADPNDTTKYSSEAIIGNKTIVKPIDQNRYTFYNNGYQEGVPYVVFSAPQQRSIDIGYYMEVYDEATQVTRTVGNLSDTLKIIDSVRVIDSLTNPNNPDTIYTPTEKISQIYKLKLLVRANNLPSDVTWQLMWRNCYDVPKGVDVEDVNFKVFIGLDGSETSGSNTFSYQGDEADNTDFLEILGLDLQSKAENTAPDGIVDNKPAIYRSDWGLVIFPSRTPFADTVQYKHFEGTTQKEAPALEVLVPELYDYTSWTEKSEASQYYIQKTTTTKGSVISLNRANIIEGSERITANGELLTKGTDYDISYGFGQVTLRSEKATDPNAEVKIDFEYAPFFAVQKKSLLGLRAEYEWSKDLQFGSTFLYKSDKAQERKPKVGQETARTVIFDADFALKLHPNFLTSMVDALPLIESDAPSTLNIEGEIAQSHPNPNVDDVAYVDDFETALDNVALGLFRTTWKLASEPIQVQNKNYAQSKLLWHQPVPQVPITDIYDRDTQAGTGQMRVFRMIFRPNQFMKTDPSNIPDSNNVKTWGGIMRAFGSPLQENRVKLFEVRMKGKRGKVHFDFGIINEDLNNNGNADTEDQNNSGRVEIDEKVLDEVVNEETGLDLLFDEQEDGYDPLTNPDPNGDDWYSFSDAKGKCPLPGGDCGGVGTNDYNNPIFYDFLNGTEGNTLDGTGSLPDKESYSSSFTTESKSSYFSYVIDLDNDRDRFYVPGSERYPDGDLTQEPWVTYRIPIRDAANLDGIYSADPSVEPKWNDIRHIRVWMEADETQKEWDTLEIADWYFVQPSWKDSVIYSPLSDLRSTFVVSSISDDVDETFTPPPNVESYKDPASGVIEVQKALQLSFENLNYFDTCIAVKNLLTIDQYSGYRRMEMYVHGDELNTQDIDKVRFFFRIGRDADNYYEYHTDIKPGWNEENYVNIDFNDLTALKDSALKELVPGEVLSASNKKYSVYGKPNINEIKFLAVGVTNKDTSSAITGNIWIDELRVTEVRKDVGTAGRLKVAGSMSDFISYNFSLKSTDPYFRGLSSATRGGSDNNLGSGQHSTYLSSNVTFKMQKLLPRSWSASIPISLGYSKTVRTPLLRSNSDIILPEEIRLEEQKISESKSLSVSAQFKKKTSNPIFSVLLNRLNSRFSYRQSNYKDVNTPYQYGEVMDFKADYDLSISKTPKIPIFFFLKSVPILKKTSNSELQLYPKSWTMNGSFVRNLSITDKINASRRSSLQRDFAGSMKLDFQFFDNLSAAYGYDTKRDLTDLDQVNLVFNMKDFKLGVEERFSQRFNASYDPHLISFFTTSFSYKSTYGDDWEATQQTRRSTMSRNMSVSGNFNHQAMLGGTGKTRDSGSRHNRRRGRSTNVITEENNQKDKFYEPVLSGIRKLTGWIDPITYSYSTSFNNSLPGMLKRPDYKYLFGFRDDAQVETIEDTRVQQSGEGITYDLSSGFTLLGGLVTTVKYRKSLTRDLVRTGSLYEDQSISWPDLTIRINRFTHLPLIKKYVNKFIEIFSPRTGYSKSVKQRFDITQSDSTFTTSKSISKGYNPLISVNFKLFRSLSLNSSVSKTININENYNLATNLLQYTSTTTNQTFALTAKYSFSSPHGISIPLFGKIKFNSTVDISMNVKYNSSKTENDNVVGKDNVTKDDSSISFNPVIAYSFSRQITGGITMRWQDQNGLTSRHTREVQLWTEITF